MAAGVVLELDLALTVEEAQKAILQSRPEAVIQDEAKQVLRMLYEYQSDDGRDLNRK